ncbi:hypothetical protein IT568_11805 [bacterium]|nr:hypothetical protein [bacterium]
MKNLTIFLLLLFSFSLKADVIKLKNGSTLEGKILSHQGGSYKINIEKGTRVLALTISESEVEKVIKQAKTSNSVILEAYNQRKAEVISNSPDSWYDFGVWCKKHKELLPESEEAFEKCLALDPNYTLAREALGKTEEASIESDKSVGSLVEEYEKTGSDSTLQELLELRKSLSEQNKLYKDLQKDVKKMKEGNEDRNPRGNELRDNVRKSIYDEDNEENDPDFNNDDE